MKILVTSSTGLTGKAVIKSLAEKGAHVRAMIHSDRRKDEMLSLGAAETIITSTLLGSSPNDFQTFLKRALR